MNDKARAHFEDPRLYPHGMISEGKLFIVFLSIESLPDDPQLLAYWHNLYELYFMVNEYRGKKPVVMYDLGRGVFTNRSEILQCIRDRLKPRMTAGELAAFYLEAVSP